MAQLAASLKNLLTILLLILLAGQASGCLPATPEEICFAQEADDKGKKSGEEKKHEKEYPAHNGIAGNLFLRAVEYPLFSHPDRRPPVVDQATPPPDMQ